MQQKHAFSPMVKVWKINDQVNLNKVDGSLQKSGQG